jgi:hypothetical protein
LGIVTLVVLTGALVLDVSRQQAIYYAEVTYNAPYAAAEPGHASIIYNFVVYYVATTNKATYTALLDLDGAGTVWAVIPASSIPAEWDIPCWRESDTSVWSTVAPGYKQAARGYCEGTFGPGIGESGRAAPPGSELWAVGITSDSVGKKPSTYSHPLIESLTWKVDQAQLAADRIAIGRHRCGRG